MAGRHGYAGHADHHYRALEVVSIPNELYKSWQGEYFLGQTELLEFGSGNNAWGGLINPPDSKVNLFLTTFAVSNIEGPPFIAQIWFNTNPPGAGIISNNVTPGNTTIIPPPIPRVELQYNPSNSRFPSGGTNAFDRVVPTSTTIADDKEGKFIIPPSGSFIIFLAAPPSPVKARVAFGWWEEKARRRYK